MEEMKPNLTGEFRDEFAEQYVQIDQRDEYERYLKELKHIAYNDIPSDVRTAVMVVSDSQAILNRFVSNPIIKSDELIRKVIPNMLATKLINICPMLGPSMQVFTQYEGNKIKGTEVFAKTRLLKTRVSNKRPIDDMAKELIKEFDEEIINDLCNIAEVKSATYKDVTRKEFDKELNKMQNDFADFADICLIMSKVFYEKHKETFKGTENPIKDNYGVLMIETIPYYVHIIDEMPQEGVLVVAKTDDSGGSYFWCPYVFLTAAEGDRYCTRYAKKYIKKDRHHFGFITFDKEREAAYNI